MCLPHHCKVGKGLVRCVCCCCNSIVRVAGEGTVMRGLQFQQGVGLHVPCNMHRPPTHTRHATHASMHVVAGLLVKEWSHTIQATGHLQARCSARPVLYVVFSANARQDRAVACALLPTDSATPALHRATEDQPPCAQLPAGFSCPSAPAWGKAGSHCAAAA